MNLTIDKETLERKIAALDLAIANYEDLDCDMESPEYIARGNGFCDSKYSETFITSQLERLKKEKAELEEIRREMGGKG